MIKKFNVTFLVLTLLISVLVGIKITEETDQFTAAASTIIVGPNEAYTTIQDAVDNAKSGDVVHVKEGTYFEQVNITKTISLEGQSKQNTIINGKNEIGSIIMVTADNVTIKNLTIIGDDDLWSLGAIVLQDVLNCRVENCVIRDNNGTGLYLLNANNNTINDNTIARNIYVGLSLENAKNNIISNNDIMPENDVGFSIGYSQNNEIKGNKISRNKLAGIDIWQSENNIIHGNEFSENSGNAIEFWGANNNNFSDNNVSSNLLDGIHQQGSLENIFKNNRLNDDGFSFGGFSELAWTSHEIEPSNKVNSKPVYYWSGRTGGTVPGGAGQIILAGCSEVTIENQDISRTSEGIILGYSDNITITNNKLNSNNRYGMSLWASGFNDINNNQLNNNKEAGIYIFYSIGNTIGSNTLSNNNIAMELQSARYHTIENNSMTDNGLLLNGNFRDYWRSEQAGNKVYDEFGKVLWAYEKEYWTTHTISDSNTVNDKPVYYWKNRADETIPDDAGQVILANCNNITVINQNFNSVTVGIELGFSKQTKIINNIIVSSQWHGIYVESSDNNLLSGNLVTLSNKNGIHLDYSNENKILGNNISSNSENGIYCYYSLDNEISENIVLENMAGIYIDWECKDNTIFHNDIIRNAQQATDWGENNWSKPYPIGGNYWNDFSGQDNVMGKDQNITGKDNIGDGYYVDIESWLFINDTYPLMTPLAKHKAILIPNEPQNLQLSSGVNYVQLTWKEPSSLGGINVLNYRIYRGDSKENMTLLYETGPDLEFNDTNVTSAETYYYSISSVNIFNEGPRTTEMSIEVKTKPDIEDDGTSSDLLYILLIVIVIIIFVIIILIVAKTKKKPVDTEKTKEQGKGKEKGKRESKTTTKKEK